jgi:F-type H+-transporting ATPase subunit b
LVDVNWTLLAQAANFLILVALVTFFAYKPVAKIMNERQQKIAESIENAENLKWAAEKIKAEHEHAMAKAREEAAIIIEKAKKTAEEASAQIMSEVHAEKDNLMRIAKEQIEQEKLNALLAMRTEVVSLSMQLAGKVVEQKLDAEMDQKLIAEFLDEITSKPGGLPC